MNKVRKKELDSEILMSYVRHRYKEGKADLIYDGWCGLRIYHIKDPNLTIATQLRFKPGERIEYYCRLRGKKEEIERLEKILKLNNT